MRRPHLFALAVVGALAAPATASAAPCTAHVTDAPALVDGVRAACSSAAGERALFRWSPASAGHVVVDLQGTTFDAVLDVHREGRDGGPGERIATWDQGDPRAAEHVAFLADGSPVLFVVRGYAPRDAGTVSIGVTGGPPANALPEGALPIALGADGLGAVGLHWGGGSLASLGAASVQARWFRFTAARTGRMTASTCTAYAGDTLVSAYLVERDGGLTLLSSNDDTPLPCTRAGASFAGFPVAGGREYRLAVRPAPGGAIGPETLVLGWDDHAPEATVDVGPAGVVADRSAAFAWSSPASDAVGFECSLDGAGFAPCAAAYAGLGDGDHAFRVRALDAAGNVGPAAERSWRVAGGSVAASAASSRARRVVVSSQKVDGPRSAPARGLAKAFEGRPRARFATGARGTRVLALALPGLKPGAQVEVRCARRGNGCPFSARRIRGSLARPFRGRTLSDGAVLEVVVTRPGTVGRVFRWTTRKGTRPRAEALCVPPGTARATAC